MSHSQLNKGEEYNMSPIPSAPHFLFPRHFGRVALSVALLASAARAQTPDPSGVRAVPAYEAAGLQTSPITETAN